MKAIWGLTGGIGSGKSTILNFLKEKDDLVCVDTDRLAKRIMERYDVVIEIGKTLGTEVVQDGWQNGQFAIDFKVLATMVFTDPVKKAQLEAIVHPLVWAEVEKIRHDTPASTIVVVESAIIFETNSRDRFDGIVLALCESTDEQVRRVIKRGSSFEEAMRRIRTQAKPEEIVAACDHVIYTNKSLASVKAQTEAIYQKFKEVYND